MTGLMAYFWILDRRVLSRSDCSPTTWASITAPAGFPYNSYMIYGVHNPVVLAIWGFLNTVNPWRHWFLYLQFGGISTREGCQFSTDCTPHSSYITMLVLFSPYCSFKSKHLQIARAVSYRFKLYQCSEIYIMTYPLIKMISFCCIKYSWLYTINVYYFPDLNNFCSKLKFFWMFGCLSSCFWHYIYYYYGFFFKFV